MIKNTKKYDKSSESFLETSVDFANNTYEAFKIDDEIHIVYNIGTEKEYVTTKKISKIINYMDDYLWTPYIKYV